MRINSQNQLCCLIVDAVVRDMAAVGNAAASVIRLS